MDTKYIILHCSDSNYGDIKEIDLWHRARGWNKIGYHYVITNGKFKATDDIALVSRDGLIQIGRQEDEQGAHCLGYNSTSIGICLIGKTIFTTRQWASAYSLVLSLMERYSISVSNILGHCETDSGKRENKTCPNFSVEIFRNNISKLDFDYQHLLLRAGKKI